MTTREVVLDGGSPWGFRMHGGVDVQQPLRISRVNPGSKAANKGIREGDIITSINNQPTRDLSNSDAHVFLKRSGDNLKLGLNEDCKASPKRRQYKTVQQENHSESIERSNTKRSCTKTVTLTINRNHSDITESETLPTKFNGHDHNGDPENGVISQRSTLSSSCSSSPSVTSLQGESKATREEMPVNPYEKWVGMPTQQDPKVLVCLSPTQKSHLETTRIVPNEAGKLLELHEMYLNRRGYYENPSNEHDDTQLIKIIKLPSELDAVNENLSQPTEFSNRLLAIIRESSNAERSLDAALESTERENKNNQLNGGKFNLNQMEVSFDKGHKTLDGYQYLEWSNLARGKSASVPQISHEFSNTTTAGITTGSYQSKVLNEDARVQSSDGNTTRSTNIPNRRFSLPQEVHQRQIQYIREKEREIREEIEKLENEKRKLLFEMAAEVPLKQFEASQYHISKQGDIAIRNDENQPEKTDTEQQNTIVMAPTEIFRQQMYNEYMQKIADREERKLHKVIKITSTRTSENNELIENNNNLCDVTHVSDIENEFMGKVKERMRKYGFNRNDSEESLNAKISDHEDSTEPVLIIDGESLKHSKGLPRHLQEFVDLTRRAADNPEDNTAEGVWSPGQKKFEEKITQESTEHQQRTEEDEATPPVWTPRSAGSSPTAGRKEYKPVNFESPTLRRKNKPKPEGSETPDTPTSQPSWKLPASSSNVGVTHSSSSERRLPTSHSAPSSGFSEFSSSRLPRAQNPTITLLQKAREGQLPRGASYIQTEPICSYKSKDDRPAVLSPGQVLYHIKNEYTISDSDNETPRRMTELSQRKYEVGIGPTTKDGMPLVLRSEVQDGNQSRWYKKMYDTIHKQKPDPRYPYASGYFSEPEQHSAFSAYYYDSDGTTSDNKYATLDRRRIPPSRDKENDYMSSTIPRQRDTVNSEVIRHDQDILYKNQPGRIENYIPGRSSISEKEAKEWWDEVMDIFDGHLEQQQKATPQARGYMSQALKESGYESDSTLIFRRREDAMQLSPSEQREAYKTIQKGGDVPLHGLRKPAPERPKEIQYLPISPTLKRIRTNKLVKPPSEIVCYPLAIPPHPRHIFAEYKRTAPSTVLSYPTPKSFTSPPSPPKRRSSRNSNTMRLISTISVHPERSPSSKRHETCFTPTSVADRNKVKYLKDKITCKLLSKQNGDTETKSNVKITKTVRTSNSYPHKGNGKTDVNSLKSSCSSLRSSSCSPIRRTYSPVTSRQTPLKNKPGTFGTEKRKTDFVLPKSNITFNAKHSKSTDLLSPREVKKTVVAPTNTRQLGATYKKSNALYSSVKNGTNIFKDKSLPIQVGITQRGRELLRPSRAASSLPGTPVLSRSLRSRNTTPSPCPSTFSEKSKGSSQKSQSTSLDSLKPLKIFKKESTTIPKTSLCSLKMNKASKQKVCQNTGTVDSSKKLKKSKKDQLNGEIAKREKKTKTKSNSKDKVLEANIVDYQDAKIVYPFSQDQIQKQRDAIQTHSFFQNLFWKDIPSPPSPSITSRTSWIAEKTRLFQQNPFYSEPTIGALRIYLNHTKPVTESKFKTLDAFMLRSRSVSPKSVTWSIDKEYKHRSISLPPKIILTETSRPISPILRKKISRDYIKEKSGIYESSSSSQVMPKIVLTETSRPISPVIQRRRYNSQMQPNIDYTHSKTTSISPSSKLIFTETSRPISPVVQRKIKNEEHKVHRSSSLNKMIFSETSRPVSPVITRKIVKTDHNCGVKKSASTSKLIFSQTSRPISPVVEKKDKYLEQDLGYVKRPEYSEGHVNLASKLFFSETSRPVSPSVERSSRIQSSYSGLGPREMLIQPPSSFSPYLSRSGSPVTKIIFTETSRPVSPIVERRQKKERRTSPDSLNAASHEVERFRLPERFEGTYSPFTKSASTGLIHSTTTDSRCRTRSQSPSTKLYFSETSRSVSPIFSKNFDEKTFPKLERKSEKLYRLPYYRDQEESTRRSVSSKSVDKTGNFIFYADDESIASSDIPSEYKSYRTDILHSSQRCNRFKELNKFYTTLERMGELERTTSSNELRPRGKREEEIIDYDRWKEVHTRERAEKELETVYCKLKDDQKEKGFLFRPKDVESFRWKQQYDRGLRIKDKSVESIKYNFEKLKNSSDRVIAVPDEVIFHRDLYKPLWRGSSVVDLASNMVERRSQSEGRVSTIKKKMLESERLLTHGIGSRIWSSLSSEQINLLKGQLSEIYSQNGHKKIRAPPPVDYSIDVPVSKEKIYKPVLRVRRNSNEVITTSQFGNESENRLSLVLSETEKKRLSHSLSREVINRMSQRQENRASLSLVKGKETRGAIAAADANIKAVTSEVVSPRTCYSLEISEDEKDKVRKDNESILLLSKNNRDEDTNKENSTIQQPKKALVSTDITNRVTSVSETESGSTDESTKTVIYLGNKDVVQKKVEYFEQVAEERPYTPTIYRAAEAQSNDGEPPSDTQQNSEIDHIEEVRQPRKLVASQSYQDLKELFGEQEQNKFSALNLSTLNSTTVNWPSVENLTSNHDKTMRIGEVHHLKNKFEYMDDFCGKRITSSLPRRTRSNPELYRKQIVIPGQVTGEVDTLRRKYEYPWIFSRGRSRIRRGGVVSPIYFRAEDRYMPHINIISKIASLYPKKTVFLSDVRQKSAEELAKILGCPIGEVERLRRKFDSPDRNISILGHMFTSSPNIHELRDIAPYLTGSWIAHKYPKMEDNTRSLSSPENLPLSRDNSLIKRDRARPKSTSPPRPKIIQVSSPILKRRPQAEAANGLKQEKYDPKKHQPVGRYQPPCPKFEPVRVAASHSTSERTSWNRLFRNRISPEICGERCDNTLQNTNTTGSEGSVKRRRIIPSTSRTYETRL